VYESKVRVRKGGRTGRGKVARGEREGERGGMRRRMRGSGTKGDGREGEEGQKVVGLFHGREGGRVREGEVGGRGGG